MTQRQHLENLVEVIGNLANIPTSRENAESSGKSYYLQLEHNSHYGGYRLVGVKVDSGGHIGAFGDNGIEPRMKGKEMEIKLRGIISGIEYAQKQFFKVKN